MKCFLTFISIHLFFANCESARSTNPECDFSNPNSRVDGGFPGITQQQCENNLGFCFDNTIAGTKQCIKSNKKLNSSQCDFRNPQNRVDGGFPGISKKECVTTGNCFDDSTPNTKWCFKYNVTPEPVQKCVEIFHFGTIFSFNICYTPKQS